MDTRSVMDWSAVCPRCSTQNSQADKECSNCGRGPLKYIEETWVSGYPQTRSARYYFQCQACNETYSDVGCRSCGTYIGGVVRGVKGSEAADNAKVALGCFLTVVAVIVGIFIVIAIIGFIKGCSSSTNDQQHSSGASVVELHMTTVPAPTALAYAEQPPRHRDVDEWRVPVTESTRFQSRIV